MFVIATGLLVALRASPFGFDAAWMDEVIEHRSPWWDAPSRAMNFLGGGWFGVAVVPVVTVVILLVMRRRWSAVYFALASVLSAGLVQLLKAVFSRARPGHMLVTSDLGSFPSGHVANAATLAFALALIARRAWLWIAAVAYAVLMALSRTYLGVHWVSDTVGGFLLGAAVALMLWAPFAEKLLRERGPG